MAFDCLESTPIEIKPCLRRDRGSRVHHLETKARGAAGGCFRPARASRIELTSDFVQYRQGFGRIEVIVDGGESAKDLNRPGVPRS